MNPVFWFSCAALFALSFSGLWAGHAVNDKKVPENREDLESLQSALRAALPQAMEATVCIEGEDGSGTGVIVSPEGLILTAAHVTGGVGRELTVLLKDGRKVDARSLGLTADTDAAMVMILEKGPWPHVRLGGGTKSQSGGIFGDGSLVEWFFPPEKHVKVGNWVFSLGHSGGFDKERGMVARLGRIVRVSDSAWESDCILIGGDSGGPLFDLDGDLIGIHSRVGDQLGQNIHVPLAEFREHWGGLRASRFLNEGPFASAPPKGSGFLGILTEAAEGGLLITKLAEEAPVEEVGIKTGDLLLRINGRRLASPADLRKELSARRSGEVVLLEWRSGEVEQKKELNLGER